MAEFSYIIYAPWCIGGAMEAVYLFRENGAVRVPFKYSYYFEKRLYDLLLRRGGVWNNQKKEMILPGNVDLAELSEDLAENPLVLVDEKAKEAVRLYNFWERPWTKIDNKNQPETPNIPSPLPQPPGKLPGNYEAGLETELRSRKYSARTIKAYTHYVRFLFTFTGKPLEEIEQHDIKHFLAHLEKDMKYSSSSMNLAISAIKFFYRNLLKKEIIHEKTRPRADKLLPMVLDKTEVEKIIRLEENAKHRLLLMLVYSSGLRVSEVVALKKEHIDLARKTILVKLGKGRKDRSTILSEKAAAFIKDYILIYSINTWLFPGSSGNRHLSIRAAQYIFDHAVRRAEIPKRVSIHSLRHTFATHLLESGIDIRYIQELLGHTNLRTTERYTHIARRNVLSIISPLDTI